MLIECPTSAVAVKDISSLEYNIKFSETSKIFPEEHVALATEAVIAALKDGFQLSDLLPLAIATVRITYVFYEVRNMDSEQRKQIFIRVMHNVIRKEAEKRPQEFTPEIVEIIFSATDKFIDIAYKIIERWLTQVVRIS